MFSPYVSMVKLQDIVIDALINTHLLPLLTAYGPTPDVVSMAEKVRICT